MQYSFTFHNFVKRNEKASEAVHSDLKKTWNRYKTTANNSKFCERLFAAVTAYNSVHI
jgi:hypothetical protein